MEKKVPRELFDAMEKDPGCQVITPDYANALAVAAGPFLWPKMVLSIMRSALANLHPANLCMVQ